MKKVILFGATGHLGREIAVALKQQGYSTTAVVRSEAGGKKLTGLVQHIVVADVINPAALSGICSGFDVVVSALGKSVSPNDRSRHSFREVDLAINSQILSEAIKAGINKFVYISALHAEKYPHLTYFQVHHRFSEKLKASGIDYAIIKPPALFSAFLDILPLAKKGRLVTIGKGEKKTNPIAEADLAQICVKAIDQPNAEIEAGGKEILTRKQINVLIQLSVAPSKKVRRIPLGVVKAGLPVMKLLSRNLFDKAAFFVEVMQHDTIAPRLGQTTLDEYIRQKISPAKNHTVINSKNSF